MQKIGEGNSKVIKSKLMSDLIVTPVPDQKKGSLSFILKTVFVVLMADIILLAGIYYYQMKLSKPAIYKDLTIANVSKLKKVNYKFIAREDLDSKASGNCMPVDNNIKEGSYFDLVTSKLLKSAGIRKENISGLIIIATQVENSNNCQLIWLIDKDGEGLVGYKDLVGKFLVNKSRLSPEELSSLVPAGIFDRL